MVIKGVRLVFIACSIHHQRLLLMRLSLSSLLLIVLCVSTFSGTAFGAQPHVLSSNVRVAQADGIKGSTSPSPAPEPPTNDQTPDSKEKRSVIVPTFTSIGDVSPADLDTITGLIVYQISKVARLQVITMADLQEMLALEA